MTAFQLSFLRASSFGSTYSSQSTITVGLVKDSLAISQGNSEAEKPRKSKRRVTFDTKANQVFTVQCRRDFSKKECANIWYQEDEFQRTIMALIPIVNLMAAGVVIPETDNQTTRGLEFRTRNGSAIRKQNKVASIDAVLDEQDRQLEKGRKRLSFTQVSAVYKKYTAPCVKEAYERGLRDEVVAKQVYNTGSSSTTTITVTTRPVSSSRSRSKSVVSSREMIQTLKRSKKLDCKDPKKLDKQSTQIERVRISI